MAGRRATEHETQHLLDEIEIAFRGVKKGVSWSESRVIDFYGTSEERGIARALDKDKCWQEVALDPNWDPEPGVGGWFFLDSHGFRYYMAAAMAKALREKNPDTLTEYKFGIKEGHMRTYWSEFTDDQMRLVAEFVLTMSRLSDHPLSRQQWRETYEKHWQKLQRQSSQKLKRPTTKKGN